MDRIFYTLTEDRKYCICSDCGRRMLRDRYNLKKHAQMMHPGRTEPVPEMFDEKKICGYRLRKQDKDLLLEIVYPETVRLSGFEDRFEGAVLRPVFTAVYSPGSREVHIENQTEVSLDGWIDRIDRGNLMRGQEQRDARVIRSCFPQVADIWSLRMFDHIYRNKGFMQQTKLPEAEGKELLREQCGQVRALRENASGSRQERSLREEEFYVRTGLEEKDGRTYLKIVADCTEKGRLKWRSGYVFSDEGAFVIGNPDLKKLLIEHRRDDGLFGQDPDAEMNLRTFGSACPQYHLNAYLDGGGVNPLIPLLGPDYHCVEELFVKTDLPLLAELPGEETWNRDPSNCRNLKELTGLPVPLLKRLDDPQLFCNRHLFRTLKNTKAHDPQLLDVAKITPSMVEFLEGCGIGMEPGYNGPVDIAYFERFSKQQVVKIVRYAAGLDLQTMRLYRDYLNICMQMELTVKDFPEGLEPKDPQRAHDTALQMVNRMRWQVRWGMHSQEKQKFEDFVSDEAYGALTEKTDGEMYMIAAPTEPADLMTESAVLHHCVRTYIGAVASGSTRIYFLRKQEEPEHPYGTIEVRNKTVIQVKMVCNSHADRPTQEYVRAWAARKRLKINTWDLNETA